ncbi:hypothetical protein MCOR02_005935 [Pyricularia oryzae]|nr:hypothetical protein MCOR01_007469 [Pyricularia oryzae]KAH9433899.1 hypothetical protein MCOR02_005935 [Pyricularia oryzae]KAI6511878.1 hypothetical protein MCOR13_000440 [Pyricularia oryzae]KAI6580043.1 hypothetical protein MCOR04_005857 [Pyricularia oryzae]KAI6640351.1 hypothetical protein MCOR14_003522 [Pyricularia oryzae]
MKFRDGMWQSGHDMALEYAEEVHQIRQTEKGMRLLCPTRKIMGRGDTLNRSVLTIDIEAEFDGVVSVETTHWSGEARRGPHFELYPDGRPPVRGEVSKSDSGTTLSSGSLSVTVSSEPHTFEVRFHGNSNNNNNSEALLTSLLDRSVGIAYNPATVPQTRLEDMRGVRHHVFTQTTLSVGESVYGFGERFGAFNKVGQQVVMWNADGGTSSELAYKNVPFWISSRGYGVFVDSPDRVEFEVGSERSCRVQTSVEAQRLKWFVIHGPSPRDVLQKYAILTGKGAGVPAWSYGLWLSTSFTTDYDEETVRGFLEGMRERRIAVDVFHYDCFWMKEFTWTDFVFDAEKFPDPKAMIARFKEGGLLKKVCCWINPYIAEHGAIFQEAAEKGYLLKRKNGVDVWQWDLWQAGMALVDFTNPDACKWYADCLDKLLETGVDAIKTDFGERIPWQDVQWHDGSVDPRRMHNYYAFLYNRCVYEAMERRRGPGQAVLFARAATAGTQRFPLVWGGDCESTAEGMAESVRGGLSLGLAAYPFWSVDIGGFEGRPPPWIYKRWVAFGLLCSHSRLHGSASYRVPWLIDHDDRAPDGCSATLSSFTALKNRLMPYLLAQAARAVDAGLPLSLRATLLEFPDDPTAWFLDRQFMLGESLLAAPVFDQSGEVQFYLPRGAWTCFFTGRRRLGPGWFRERHRFGTLPLYVRPGTVLLLRQDVGFEESVRDGAVYDFADRVEVRLYEVKEKDGADVVGADGQVVGRLEVGEDGETLSGLHLLQGETLIREPGFGDQNIQESGIECLTE